MTQNHSKSGETLPVIIAVSAAFAIFAGVRLANNYVEKQKAEEARATDIAIDMIDKCASQYSFAVRDMNPQPGKVIPMGDESGKCAVMIVPPKGGSLKVTWNYNKFEAACKTPTGANCNGRGIEMAAGLLMAPPTR